MAHLNRPVITSVLGTGIRQPV